MHCPEWSSGKPQKRDITKRYKAFIVQPFSDKSFWCPDTLGIDEGPYENQQLEKREKLIKERELHLKEWEVRLRKEQVLQKNQKTQQKSNTTIYVITPTYSRPVQKAELTRISQTFLHVDQLHWIIIEDSFAKTELVSNFLSKSGLVYTHLNILTPPSYKLQESDPNWLKPRGVLQRNKGIEWLRSQAQNRRGVIYFADDDNTYDLELFEEMRSTKLVTVWPVGLVGGLLFEGPKCENKKVTGWHTFWKPERPFPIDMAGFAINLQLLLHKVNAKFALRVRRGYQESVLLQQLVTQIDLEPRADNCSKILVWHTRTEAANLKNEAKMKAMGIRGSDPNMEV